MKFITQSPDELDFRMVGQPVDIWVQRKNGYALTIGDFSRGVVRYSGILEEFIFGKQDATSEQAFVFRMKGWDQRTRVYTADSQVIVVVGYGK